MSAVISDATFERQMYCLHLSLGELCHYSQWHKEEPTRPLVEMIRIMTTIREESEEEASKRALEDWAWETEEGSSSSNSRSNRIPCEHCFTIQHADVCDVCYSTLARYEDLSCAFCVASYKGHATGDWHNPCTECHPQYIADYRYVEEQQVMKALVTLASGPGPDEHAAMRGLMTLASGPGPEDSNLEC